MIFSFLMEALTVTDGKFTYPNMRIALETIGYLLRMVLQIIKNSMSPMVDSNHMPSEIKVGSVPKSVMKTEVQNTISILNWDNDKPIEILKNVQSPEFGASMSRTCEAIDMCVDSASQIFIWL